MKLDFSPHKTERILKMHLLVFCFKKNKLSRLLSCDCYGKKTVPSGIFAMMTSQMSTPFSVNNF